MKLLLNLALLAGDALVRGGRLDVGAEQRDGDVELVIRAEGPRILLDPVLRETLATAGAAEPSNRGLLAPGSRIASPRRPAERSSCPTSTTSC